MKEYSGKNIKNVAVLGHTGAGKSEVLESMLFNTKVTDRFGKAVDGNSIIDYDSEEIKRGMTVYSSIVPIEWKDYKINFIDTPGFMDFAGEQVAALAVCDAVMIVVSAKDGIQPGRHIVKLLVRIYQYSSLLLELMKKMLIIKRLLLNWKNAARLHH